MKLVQGGMGGAKGVCPLQRRKGVAQLARSLRPCKLWRASGSSKVWRGQNQSRGMAGIKRAWRGVEGRDSGLESWKGCGTQVMHGI